MRGAEKKGAPESALGTGSCLPEEEIDRNSYMW
jgi:hypothetical protein